MTTTVTAVIDSLTVKGLASMTAIALGRVSFFDQGLTEGSGSYGAVLTGDLGHKSSGVINRLKALGIFEADAAEGDDGAWWTLTELGAQVARYIRITADEITAHEMHAEWLVAHPVAEIAAVEAASDLAVSAVPATGSSVICTASGSVITVQAVSLVTLIGSEDRRTFVATDGRRYRVTQMHVYSDGSVWAWAARVSKAGVPFKSRAGLTLGSVDNMATHYGQAVADVVAEAVKLATARAADEITAYEMHAEWLAAVDPFDAPHGTPGHEGTPGDCAGCHAEEFGVSGELKPKCECGNPYRLCHPDA